MSSDEQHDFASDVKQTTFWDQITNKNDLMEFAMDLTNYFRRKLLTERGVDFRFVSVKDIEYSGERIANVIHIKVKAILLTDEGEHTASFVVREFKDPDALETELEAYETLQNRFSRFVDVEVPELITVKQKYNVVIYNDPPGKYVKDIPRTHKSLEFILGRVCAAVQGNETIEGGSIEINSQMFQYLLEMYAFTDEERESIFRMAQPFLEMVRHGKGGYTPFTVFDPSSIKLHLFKSLKNASEDDIINGNVSVAYPFIKFIDKRVYDRIEDIATEYTERLLEEFFATGNITKNKQGLIWFLRGYQSALLESLGQSLESIYPQGVPLEFFIVLTAFILKVPEVTKYLKKDPDHVANLTDDLLRFAYFMLVKKPLQESLQGMYQ